MHVKTGFWVLYTAIIEEGHFDPIIGGVVELDFSPGASASLLALPYYGDPVVSSANTLAPTASCFVNCYCIEGCSPSP